MKTCDKLNFILQVKKSNIDGKGVYASTLIPAKKKIGELQGKIISLRKARSKAKKLRKIAIVEFGNGKALDASIRSNPLRYVNHSCFPNTFMRAVNNRVEFYSLRVIKPREELTCNYGESHHDGKLPCKCGTLFCKGAI